MNPQHRYEPTRTYRRYRCRVELGPAHGAGRWYALCMLLIVLAAALAFVYLRSEGQKMDRQLQAVRRDCAMRAKEVANLNMEVESFKCGDYILTAVERLELGLRRPLPGQVRRMNGRRAEETDSGWATHRMVAQH